MSMSTQLDCGHPEDAGHPATVRQADGSYKTIQGWTFKLLDDGRKVCKACYMALTVLDCGHHPSEHSDWTTGYGTHPDGKRSCYACCSAMDREAMILDGHSKHLPLYFNGKEVKNWCGGLRFTVSHVRHGRHNMAGSREDFWFTGPDGKPWWGYQVGKYNTIAHCRRVKS